MNQRQKLKKLKRDNRLMRDIINNTPEMARLYKAYNEPIKNVIHTTVDVKQFVCKRSLDYNNHMAKDIVEEYTKNEIISNIYELLQDVIEIEIDDSGHEKFMIGRIWIGERKGGAE